MSRKRFNLDKQEHFPPFTMDGNWYDLSHLDSHKVEYLQESDGKDPIKYTFFVTYSMHCFAKDSPQQTISDKDRLMYQSKTESRPFCLKRYNLSLQLRKVIEGISSKDAFVFHGGYETYATYMLNDPEGNPIEYYISFVTYRYQRKLRLHVRSAYSLDEPLGKRKKVGFFKIAYNLLRNKKLPR
ncbi:Heat shock protein C [Shewanella benthica]|uniref:Heat shock protein C n=1 Tax=Shewanella benthica TaxID=43661 RepID=A0A330LV89_9GAMM|nr:heat-shock protein [Shewanella benthica]SQH74096.1 Heat shock protein C [Shewanella benthica]